MRLRHVIASAATFAIGCFGVEGLSDRDTPSVDAGDAPDSAVPDVINVTDAGPEAEAGGPFCETRVPRPTFCADFDVGDLPAPWDQVVRFGTGQLLLDTVAAAGSPRSLLAKSPQQAGTDQGAAYVRKKLSSTPVKLTIELDLRLDKIGDEATLVHVQTKNSQGLVADTSLRVGEGAAEIKEARDVGGGTMKYGGGLLTNGPPLGAWSHLRWTMTFGARVTYAVEVDGVNVANLLGDFYVGAPTIEVGLGYVTTPSPPWEARFDDVAVTVE